MKVYSLESIPSFNSPEFNRYERVTALRHASPNE